MTYRRERQIDLTPWCRDAVGRDDVAAARLPKGWRLLGHASPRKDSWKLVLYRLEPDPLGHSPLGLWTVVAERATAIRADVPAAFQSLVDLAWIGSPRCHYCGREPEMSARLGDRIVGLCGTCYERGREAAGA